jgi:hypothetical protein
VEPVNLEAVAMAVRSIDEAVSALREGRPEDARLLAADARRAHPKIAGAYLLEAEALAELRMEEEGQAALAEALHEGFLPGRARYLEAKNLWETRHGKKLEHSQARAAALELLNIGISDDLKSAEPHVLSAELHAVNPREPSAQRSWLAALYRYQPWDSPVIILAKMQVAGDEAGGKIVMPNGVEFKVPRTSAGASLAAIRRAVRAGAEPTAVLDDLRKLVPESSFLAMLDDPSLHTPVKQPSLEIARLARPVNLPHVESRPPGPAD